MINFIKTTLIFQFSIYFFSREGIYNAVKSTKIHEEKRFLMY